MYSRLLAVCVGCACVLALSGAAQALPVNYSGDPAGYAAATIGLNQLLVDFDDGRVSEGELIGAQYQSRNVAFSTDPQLTLTAQTDAHGTPAYSSPFCASVYHSEVLASFAMDFENPVLGVEFYVLDLSTTTGDYLSVLVRNELEEELASFTVPAVASGYTHVAVLSSAMDISRIEVSANVTNDAIGFDSVTQSVVPEPATLVLCGCVVAGLCLRVRRRVR